MDIFYLIKEPIFLIASTVLSIMISIAANLLTPKFNQIFAKFSFSLKNKQAEKKKIYISRVTSAAMNETKVINIKLDVAYTLLKALIMIALSLLLFSISPYLYNAEYIIIFISLALVTYAVSLFTNAQASYKVAKLATLRAEKMVHLRAELNATLHSPEDYGDYEDPHEKMYEEYLSKWDEENL